ncbi:SAM-dependent methyltransferase [Candidatus Parcubacteria bacterium]|nr:SAM-dependent methyltransferase [Candidatus Parcubacteria bacterium]
MTQIVTLITEGEKDYELLDSGSEEKLERYGDFLLARPDPQALWQKHDEKEWAHAHGVFTRGSMSASWKMSPNVPASWQIQLGGLNFIISPTAFKHTGVFPEQVSNWKWIGEQIARATVARAGATKKVSVLNLFGYTGGATLACAKAGAEVTHVDGSKSAIAWTKENVRASGLEEKPIRFMLDDARKFVAREIKRGKKYDGIIMDPPAFGHGAKKELWKIEEHLQELLSMCKQVLSDDPLFFLLNGYASSYSAVAYRNILQDLMKNFAGNVEAGELTIRESKNGRLLPCGIFARWSKK